MSGTWADAGLRVVWTDFPEVIPDPIGDTLRADAMAYWKLDEVSGTRVDSKGGFDLSVINGASVGSATGKIGNGLAVTGNLDYIRYAGTGLSLGDVNFSVSCWVKMNSLATGQPTNVFDYMNDSTHRVEWGLETDDFGDKFVFQFYTRNGGANTYDLGTILTDTWYFMVCEYDTTNDKVRLYLDNQLASEGVINAPNTQTSNILTFGSEGVLINANCVRDEMLFIDRLLTADERTYLYNSGNGRTLFP